MILIIISFIGLVSFWVWAYFVGKIDHQDYLRNTPLSVASFLCGAVFVMCIATLFIESCNIHSEIGDFLNVKARAEIAREEKLLTLELQREISDANEWLLKKQWMNKTMWGLWVPDKVDTLEAIK